MQDRWIIFNLLHFIFNKYFFIFLQCLRSLKNLFELWNAWKKEENFRTLDFTAHEVVRWFLILLHKEKHVGTLFFHIFLIILAERVIKLCIFFISNKTSNCGLNWIYEQKRKISVLWTLQPMKYTDYWKSPLHKIHRHIKWMEIYHKDQYILVNIYFLPSKLYGSSKSRFLAKNQL